MDMRAHLRSYDYVLVNTSGGKDSQCTLDVMWRQCYETGTTDRLVAVHSDLGRVEWPDVPELAALQAAHYGVRFEIVKRQQDTLLDYVRARRMWPSKRARYCTSEYKRAPVGKLMTRLAAEVRQTKGKRHRVRILNCLGLRAQESRERAKKPVFEINKRNTNSVREVHDYLPIHSWTECQVWQHIAQTGVPHHSAYDKGMPRLSCMFCVFAPHRALVIAGNENPALLREYVALEDEIGHTFKSDYSLHQTLAAVEAGQIPQASEDWDA